ncbi:MAG: DUF255 domain-containing protein [Akkermansiaceae bacterium]|jgi:uncharacterized protein YyaL (SSP411 family)|nr:DUF255 domain-containing protein [Akkermansiaceae bacterium]
MKFPFLPAAIPLLCLIAASCGKKEVEEKKTAPPVISDHLEANQLANLPSTFLASHANSPIRWQKWEPSIKDDAAKAQRLIFAIVSSARFPGSYDTLRTIESSPRLVSILNEKFVPVLVDLDISRETSLIASGLSFEQGEPIAFPFILIVSPDGAPVSWRSLVFTSNDQIRKELEGAIEVVLRLWEDFPDYVRKDSMEKFERRKASLSPVEPSISDLNDRKMRLDGAIRRLSSYYDEDTRTLDGLGGLLPVSALRLLGTAAVSPHFDADRREACRKAALGVYEEILRSAMVDPLDGGIYSARVGKSWQHPMSHRDCPTQAQAITTFCGLARRNQFAGALDTALRAAAFAEEQFATPDGLFAIATKPRPYHDREWLWTMEQLKTALTPEEYRVWEKVAAIDRLGNIPIESDPKRRYFRLNSLSMRLTREEASYMLSIPLASIDTLLDSSRRKLIKARDARVGGISRDATPSATASFHMIRAYCALYSATGDDAWLKKAVALGEKCKAAFGEAEFLNERPGENPSPMSDCRAFTYALAARANLDLHAVTLDSRWSQWAIELMTLLSENFVSTEGRIFEARESVSVIDIDYEDRAMVFGDSTSGTTRANLQILKKLGLRPPPKLEPWLSSLPDFEANPVIFADTLESLMIDITAPVIDVATSASPELSRAVTLLPLDSFLRRKSDAATSSVILASGEKGPDLQSAADIEALIRP